MLGTSGSAFVLVRPTSVDARHLGGDHDRKPGFTQFA
jgi:hypothetical protein